MGNCFRQGSNLKADFWKLVNAQPSTPSLEGASLLWSQVILPQAAGLWTTVQNHRLAPGFWIYKSLALVLNLHSASV